MHRFFVTTEQIQGDTIQIEGMDVNHICNVLRMKVGEELQITDGDHRSYRCQIAAMDAEHVFATIVETLAIDTELPSHIYLFQGLPKNDKMEWIVQKAVELGVYEIIPVATKRAVVKLDAKKAAKKVERWQAIAEGAAKQSGRNQIPHVGEVMTYKEALAYASSLDVRFIPYELAEGMQETKKLFHQITPGQSIGIFIGPEGGFEEEEIALAVSNEVQPITLGKRILRTETAGLMVLSVLMYQLEE